MIKLTDQEDLSQEEEGPLETMELVPPPQKNIPTCNCLILDDQAMDDLSELPAITDEEIDLWEKFVQMYQK